MTGFTALLDANILYPAPMRDIFLQLAADDVFRVKWTEDIHREWIDALGDQAIRRRSQRREHGGREVHSGLRDQQGARVSSRRQNRGLSLGARHRHKVRLIPPQYIRPFVKTNKNDAADAEAICEAVTRPTMRFAPAKSVLQPLVVSPELRQLGGLGLPEEPCLPEAGLNPARPLLPQGSAWNG